MTHSHPEGIKGAQAIASCIFLLRTGETKDEIKAYVESEFGYNLEHTVEYYRKHSKFDETCQDTVPKAIVCFLESDGFVDSIRNAISIGGDSDTIACITGGLSEAFYGIPDNIFDEAYKYLDNNIKKVLKKALRTKFVNRMIEIQQKIL